MAIAESVLQTAKQGAEKFCGEQLELLRQFSKIDHGTGNAEGIRQVTALMQKVLSGMKVAVEIPEGHVGLLFQRSSVYKTSLSATNAVGVIDAKLYY